MTNKNRQLAAKQERLAWATPPATQSRGLFRSFLTVYAKDLSSPEEFADIVRQNQIAYLLGALLFGSVPGLLADWTGSYTAFYGLLTVLAVFAMVVVQRSYRKKSTSI